MAIEPRGYIQRAPYRGKDSIRSLERGGAPTIGEVGVDALKLKMRATCRPISAGNRQALRDYFESFPEFSGFGLAEWFPMPRDPQRANRLHIATRVNRERDLIQTLGHVDIRVYPNPQANGLQITIEIDGNPTRTLAHLLARFAPVEPSTFVETISALPLPEFFQPVQDAPLSLDGRTNWIEDRDALIASLGDDPYSTFLPIYLNAIRSFAETAVSAGFAPEFEADGEALTLQDGGVEVSIDTARTSIPQSEVFVERYHGRSVAGMREAALRAIDQLRDVASTFFLDEEGEASVEDRASVERRAGSLQLTTSLPHKSLLAIYPKSEKRMRIEMRRLKQFSWGDTRARFNAPMERTLSRINRDRDRWIAGGSALRWENVFALFSEPSRPHIGDMAELVGDICDVAARHGAPISSLVRTLFEDGGLAPDEIEGVGRNVLEALKRKGVLDRVLVAQRNGHATTARYVLREHHLTIAQEMALLPTIRDQTDD